MSDWRKIEAGSYRRTMVDGGVYLRLGVEKVNGGWSWRVFNAASFIELGASSTMVEAKAAAENAARLHFDRVAT